MFRRVLLAMLVVGVAFSLTNINSCANLNSPNEEYNLTQDISCSDNCTCINITADNVTLQCNGFNINGGGRGFPEPYPAGINISTVSGVTVKQCNITNFVQGIHVEWATLSDISKNTFYNDSWGTYLTVDSDNNTIWNNSYSAVGEFDGIHINGSSNYNHLNSNTVTGARYGIHIDAPYNNLTNNNLSGNNVALLVTHASFQPCINYVDESNIAGDSGDPIHFFYDSDGITIQNNGSYGELLLCNVSNSTIRNLTMTDDDGIIISFSNNNRFYNNSISGAHYAHWSYFSDNNIFFNTTVSSNLYGFEIWASDNSTICNNTLISNDIGVNVSVSEFSYLCNLNVSAGNTGISIDFSSNNNTVQNVTIDGVSGTGIGLYFSSYDNNISNVTINVAGFGTGISTGYSTTRNTFADINIYTEYYGIHDADGGDTFINTAINSSAGNFLYSSTGLASFTNLTLIRNGNTVNFPGTFDASNWTDSNNIKMGSNFVSINSSGIPELNRSANITTYTNTCTGVKVYSLAGYPSSRSDILTYGAECTPPTCNIISCSGNTIQFDVPEFTGYAGGTLPPCVNLSDSDTWLGKVVNLSGVLYVNTNITLCTDTYYSDLGAAVPFIEMNASSIFLDCNGSTIINRFSGNGYGLYLNGKENDTVRGCTFMDYQYGVYFLSSNYNSLTNSTAYGNYNGFLLSSSNYNNITNSTADSNYHGVYLLSASYNTIENGAIRGNTYGLYSSGSEYNNITNSRADGNVNHGIYLLLSNRNTFENNTVNSSTFYGFAIRWSHGNTLTNNTAYNTQDGFYLDTSDNNNLTNNTADSNSESGFYLLWARYTAFADNTAKDGQGTGIYLFGSGYNNITAASSYNNSGNGITMDNTANNILRGSTIENNSGYGIYIASSNANGNTITGNTAYNNTLFQMMVNGGWSNIIYNNIFNATGSQGVVNGTVDSSWNTTKTLGPNIIGGAYIGGNYYSDYAGADRDGDGIGQTVYIVYSYSLFSPQDEYPSEQGSSGTWTNFSNTYDQDWDTYGIAEDGADAYYNFTIPAGASTAFGTIETKGETVGVADSYIGTGWGNNCLGSDPLQVKLHARLFKGNEIIDVYCWDYDFSAWSTLGTAASSAPTDVNFYEIKAIFQIATSANSTDYLPLTNNQAYGCVNASDPTTFSPSIVNSSGVLYVNRNATLCRDSYNMNAAAATPLFELNGSGIVFDCNGSTINGVDGNGYGIYSDGKSNNTVKGCKVKNYQYGIYTQAGSGNRMMNNTVSNSYYGFYLYSSANNTLTSNTASTNSNYAVYLVSSSDSTVQDMLIDNQTYRIWASSGTQVYISNLTITNGQSMVRFNSVNYSTDADLKEDNFVISSEVAALNSSARPEFNVSARIRLPTSSCSTPVVYKLDGFTTSGDDVRQNGTICTECAIVSCAGNLITFDVPHFTGYAVGGGNSLTIDNNGPKYANETITFNATYLNTSGGHISGASCNLTLWNGSIYPMGEDVDHYELGLNVSEPGTHNYNVTCFKVGFSSLTALDTFTIIYNSSFSGVDLYRTNVTVGNTSRYSYNVSAGNITTEGGNVTNVSLDTNESTDRWAGFYGNITGNIILSKSNLGSNMYTWFWNPLLGGVVCTSTNSTPFTMIAGAAATEIDSAWSFPANVTDSAANTFLNDSCALEFGASTVSNASYADTGSPGGFVTCAFKQQNYPAKGDMLFCTNITQNGPLAVGGTGDFEMMVPTTSGAGVFETYYFYVNLG